MSSGNGWRFVGLAMVLLLGGTSLEAAPVWHTELDKITGLFDPQLMLGGMKGKLEYFSRVFTALGYGAVMISTVRKVAKSRAGEESMGWVASLVMTVALMATAPAIGKEVFETCDAVAAASGYDRKHSIKTCWDALLVILPSESPIQEVLNDTAQDKDLAKGAPVQKQDGAWTKLAWTWMKMAWSSMTNVLDKIGGAFRAVSNQILVMVLLFIPTVALIIGMVFIQLGGFLRELLHQSMDIFLPMMIAMVSFAPMRGAASNFIIKYISIALWPVAWALGNALACSILISVMDWVAVVCQTTLTTLYTTAGGGAPPLDVAAVGYLSGAAAALPWGLLQVIVLLITLTSLLIIVSAIGAPVALTATMTKGACFATAQLRQAASAAENRTKGGPTGGGSLASAASSAGGVRSGGGAFSNLALRASASMGGAASRLAPMAAMGGPGGMVASMGASALSRASHAVGGWASTASPGDSEGDAGVQSGRSTAANSLTMNPPGSSRVGGPPGGSSPPAANVKTANLAPRNYRRNKASMDN